jgi:GNAT superfamily N-acetyltransferase
MSLVIATIHVVDRDLDSLISTALHDLRRHRGGVAMERDIRLATTANDSVSFAELCVQTGALSGAFLRDSLAGVLLCAANPWSIVGVYVAPEYRRQGIGRQLVQSVLSGDGAPVDAWVLPGDRAMKSLFESVSWKARRLIMSDEARESVARGEPAL